MAEAGLRRKLGKAFILQAALISVVAALGVYAAGLVLEEVLVKQALRDEADYFWRMHDKHKEFPVPDTLNLTGYVGQVGGNNGIPLELRDLGSGFHHPASATDYTVVYVTDRGDQRLVLVFDGENVNELAFYFGLVPLAGVLVMLYLGAWIAYRQTRRAVSPVIQLAQAVHTLDLERPDAASFDPSAYQHDPNEEVSALADALYQFAQRTNEFVDRERAFTRDASHELRSPLHFGEISPHEVWYAAKGFQADSAIAVDVDHFLSELGWREFSYYLLYHWPDLPRENLQEKFNHFPWRRDNRALKKWQRGRTGYPIVDAGMRELWRTGYMHNRVRMIVASFLVKNLLLHWHHGEDWFWDTLVDADLANNSASWQWVAGSGADAAPYFRIFNPVLQGQKFDPQGAYVRKYVPEIAALPNKFIHCPWDASATVLRESKIELDKDYPRPIVDLKVSRDRALAAFKSLSAEG